MIDKLLEDEIRRISEETYKELGTRFGIAKVPRHVHDGLDSENLPFSSIHPFVERIYWTIPGIQAATATNYGVFWIAPADCIVTGVFEVHQTLGTNGGAVTLNVEKLGSGVAPGSGINMLSTAFNLKGTINVIQEGSMVKTSTNGIPDASLKMDDRLCLVDAGTLTAVANVTVMVFINYQ